MISNEFEPPLTRLHHDRNNNVQIQSKIEPETILEGPLVGKRFHLVGIGGCGMSSVARLLLDSGAVVSGSDMNAFGGAGALVEAGATIQIPHDASHLRDDVELIVRSAAVPDSKDRKSVV